MTSHIVIFYDMIIWINFIHEILTSTTSVKICVTVLAGPVMVMYKTT